MTHTQTIPNIIVIDKEWLLDKIKGYDRVIDANTPSQFTEQLKALRNELQSVINNSYPLSPIVEDAYREGSTDRILEDVVEFNLEQYLSQPIKLEK